MKVTGRHGAQRSHADSDALKLTRLIDEKRYPELERAARAVLARNARHPLALRALTFALVILGQYEETIAVADHAIRLAPTDGEIHNNRAIALSMLMRWDEAVANFLVALQHAPKDYEIYKNLGAAYTRMHLWNDAAVAFLKAIEYHPGDYVEAISLLALVLSNAKRLDEAEVCCDALYQNDPDSPELLALLVELDLRRCAWDKLGDRVERLRGVFRTFERPITNPWSAFWIWTLDAADHAMIGRMFAKAALPVSLLEQAPALPLSWREGRRRLRLGYLSADFRNHPVAAVISELIERHHRDRVELFGYSIGADDGSAQRQRLVRSFEHFDDLTKLSVEGTRSRIRADEIDILVDLTGWTTGGRVEALALRCAPIQVSWLGYAGTLGHPKLADYILGDPVVTPSCDQEFFAERIAHMPHSYMPADTTRQVENLFTRESQGLPEAAFVLCSLNNAYKFNPPLFDLWCTLLRDMPDAILWLPRHDDVVAGNLRKELVRRGISGDRLVLADRVESSAAHLSRLQLADVALDTAPFNSHSTGVDVLWAGVPLVAKRGNTFAGRVGASLLTAVGLPELIAETDADYGRLVLDLYRDRARLAKLRERLRQARQTAPLFDMEKFADDIENLFFDMARRAIAADEARPEPEPSALGHLAPGQAA